MTVPLLIASATETGHMAGLRRDCRPRTTFPFVRCWGPASCQC